MEVQDLSNSPTNPVLNKAALDRLSNYGEATAVDIVIVQQGESMGRFLVVLDGELAVEQSQRGRTERILTHGSGQFFGDVHSLSGRPSLVSGRMLTPGRILTLNRAALQKLDAKRQ